MDLERRRKGIGGSDVAAILGVNPYKSALGVYYEKVEGTTFAGNIHTEFGIWMEPIIRNEFPKRFAKAEGVEIEVCEYTESLHHKSIDIFAGNIDGLVTHPEHGLGIIEIKTAGEHQWKEWVEDKLPDMYYCQIQHYLNITDAKYAYIVALVGKKLLWKYIPRDQEFIDVITTVLINFWEQHVIPQIPPAPTGIDDDTKVLKARFPGEFQGEILVLDDMQESYNRYKAIAKEVKALETEQEQIKQTIMAAMETAEIATIGGKKITWKTINRKGYTVEPTTFRQLKIG